MLSAKSANLIFFFLTIVSLLMIVPLSFHQKIEGNLAGQQAMAFLRGDLAVSNDPRVAGQDLAVYKGKVYDPFPPGPALLLIPLILIGGPAAPVLVLTIPLTLFSVALLVKILGRIPEARAVRLWLAYGFIFGTALLPGLQAGGYVWHIAHVVAVCFVLLSLYVAFNIPGAALWKGALAGAALAEAFLSRQMTVVLAPFLIVLLWQSASTTPRRKIGLILAFLVPLALAGLGYLAFNWARFGSPFDIGYGYIKSAIPFLESRYTQYGLFSIYYVLFNLYAFLVQGFHANFVGPDLLKFQNIDRWGTSLLVASPFLVAGFYGRPNRPFLIAAWIAIGVIFVNNLLYYNNGYAQLVGPRFALDYLPVWMMLVGFGAGRLPSSLIKGFVIWAVFLNYFALFAPAFVPPG